MARAQERELTRVAESTEMTMAVVGLSGQGKSTLVNSLLLMDPKKGAAKTGNLGVAVSTDVVCHKKGRDNAYIQIWDTPGLKDETTMKTETVIELLRQRAGATLDLFLYCVAYRDGIRQSEVIKSDVINILTKHFGKEIWRRALLVFTMANKIEEKDTVLAVAEIIGNGLKIALRNAGVPEDIVRNQRLILAGLGEEPLAVDKHKTIDWNDQFFTHCLNTIQEERKRATLIQARFGRSFWRGFVDFWSLSPKEKAVTVASGGAGAGFGAMAGAKAGAVASSMSVAVGIGSGTGAGLGTGAAAAGAAGATGLTAGAVGTTGAVAGTVGASTVAGAAGTTAMAGTGGTMAAATGTSAVAGALSAGTVATMATGVGAVAVGIITVAVMTNYLMSRKRKRKSRKKD